jgi:hypothetical protein
MRTMERAHGLPSGRRPLVLGCPSPRRVAVQRIATGVARLHARSVSESCLDTLLERPAWSAEHGRLYRRPGQSQETQACRAIEQPGSIGCLRETGPGAPCVPG